MMFAYHSQTNEKSKMKIQSLEDLLRTCVFEGGWGTSKGGFVYGDKIRKDWGAPGQVA